MMTNKTEAQAIFLDHSLLMVLVSWHQVWIFWMTKKAVFYQEMVEKILFWAV